MKIVSRQVLLRTNNPEVLRTNQRTSQLIKGRKVENSALSMHAKETHDYDFNLENFFISIVKKVYPQNIRREEFRFIENT